MPFTLPNQQIALVLIKETRATASGYPCKHFAFSHFTLYETKKSQSIVLSHRKSQTFSIQYDLQTFQRSAMSSRCPPVVFSVMVCDIL